LRKETEMKNVRVKVRNSCTGYLWDYAIYDARNRKCLQYCDWYSSKSKAVRAAKAMAKRIGIPYDKEIIKQHGC
jgi:hypothetical protein